MRVKIYFLFLMMPVNVLGGAASCYNDRYLNMYNDCLTTRDYTNNICQSIITRTNITTYYCGDDILNKMGDRGINTYSNNPNFCFKKREVWAIRELRIQYEFLNEIICQEIRLQNLTINPVNTTDLYCIPYGLSNGIYNIFSIKIIYLVGVMNLFIIHF